MAVIGAGPDCEIFSDELNHASIIDGVSFARLSGATAKVYRHNNMQHLEQLLQQSSPRKRKLVITDSLFSMDGNTQSRMNSSLVMQCHDKLSKPSCC